MTAGMPEQIGIVGLGAWGTALAHHFARGGHTVIGWSRREKQISSQVATTTNILDLAQCSTIVVALPSATFRVCEPLLSQLSPETLVISAAKGLTDESRTPITYLTLAAPHIPRTAVLGGPLFAKDLTAHKVASVVVASEQEIVASAAAELLASPHLRVYLSRDPMGVELGGIVKNIVAIAAGVGDGLELGDSARATVLTRGLAEMMRIAVALGAHKETLNGLAGLGDLLMTGTSDQSRNRRFGLLLGRGESVASAASIIKETIEGLHSAPLLLAVAQQWGIDVPITTGVVSLIQERTRPEELVKHLLERPRRYE